MRTPAALFALAAATAPALAQVEVTLKNDRFPNDVTTVADAQMSIQAGFVAGEIALAVLNVPTNLQGSLKVKRVQIMWASTAPGQAPPSEQGSIMIYKGSVLQPNWQLMFDSANDGNAGDGLIPQLQDGGLNEFDLSGENIIIDGATKLSVGLLFSTPTDQQAGPSVCSDFPPGNPLQAAPGANAIYGTWPDVGINSTQFFEPSIVLPVIGRYGISGDFFIRAVVENNTSCPADVGITGGGPGQDGVLDNNDFIVFVSYFFTQNPIADIGRAGGAPGADTLYDNNDFIVFIDQFFAGC